MKRYLGPVVLLCLLGSFTAFTVEGQPGEALDHRTIPEEIRRALEARGIRLANLRLSAQEWRIVDRDDNPVYIITKQNGEINILRVLTDQPAVPITSDIAVADFTNLNRSEALEEHTQTIPTLISTRLAQEPKLSLLNRQDLDRLLDEIFLAEEGIVDAATAAKVGRAVGARYMLIGHMSSFRAGNSTRNQITTQLVEVETTRVITADLISASPDQLDSRAIELADNLQVIMCPKSPWSAGLRSLAIPGWGQHVNRRASSKVFFPLAVAGLGGLAYTQIRYNSANETYQEIVDRQSKTHTELLEAQDKRNDRNHDRRLAAGVVVGVWALNVIDAVWKAHQLYKQRPQIGITEGAVLQTRIEPHSVGVHWTKRF